MVFKCQEDSFLKEFTSTVISCEKAKINTTTAEGKKATIDGYEIILEDTILFPEGGGQPCDFGFLNGEPVIQVVRREDKAVHYLRTPLNVGETVQQTVDWTRRLDHMQQHSGQHLITAIIDREFQYPTCSWWLGETVSYIELETPSITAEQIQRAEDIVNELIREAKTVSVQVFTANGPEIDLKNARSPRGLPADHVGDIRVIDIEDVESNMCCGTHVTNLSQLQVVKLLHAEKSKRKDKTFLYFLVGNRVLSRLSACLNREQKLTVLLKNGANEHVDLVEKLLKNAKVATKNLQTLLKEVAINEATKLTREVNSQPLPKYYSLHKKEAEPDFMNNFIKELGDVDIFLFLSTGDEKGAGNIVLNGDEKVIADLGNKICELLSGKGAGKGRRFQAKVACMANRSKAEKLVAEYFQ